VLVDGETARSCILLAVQVDGCEVRTLEGVRTGGELHPVQQAFWEKHGMQCGFCTSGIVLTTLELLEHHPQPTRDEISEWLGGHLCRCTGYVKIVEAIEEAARLLAGGRP
jgi:carbon-monoxide dehydrogenase small subunit